MKRALILVDLQNDFIPGGALAVPNGDQVICMANAIMKKFDLVVATQDWHPADHSSFASQHPGRKPGEFIELNGLEQRLWPNHCVQGSRSAEFVAGLAVAGITHVVKKGTDKQVDSYSGFFDNDHCQATGLDDYLNGQRIDELAIMGLATDYKILQGYHNAVEKGASLVVTSELALFGYPPGDMLLRNDYLKQQNCYLDKLSQHIGKAGVKFWNPSLAGTRLEVEQMTSPKKISRPVSGERS